MVDFILAKAAALFGPESKGNQPMSISEKERQQVEQAQANLTQPTPSALVTQQTEQAATTQALQERLNTRRPLFAVDDVVLIASPNMPANSSDPLFGRVLESKDLGDTGLGFKYTLEVYLSESIANIDFFETELFNMQTSGNKPLVNDLVFSRKGLQGDPKRNFGIVKSVIQTMPKGIFVESKDGHVSKSCYEDAKDLVVVLTPPLGQVAVAPAPGKPAHCIPAPTTNYSNNAGYTGRSTGYQTPPDTGNPLIDKWFYTDVAYIETPGGLRYSTKLTNSEIKRAVQVLDYSIADVTSDKGEMRQGIFFMIPDENLAWKVSSKTVMCCAYNATNEFLQSKFLAKLDSGDKAWYEAHAKTVSSGLPMAFTLTVLSDLVKPYEIGIKKVWIQKNKAAYDETVKWEAVLGVNPAAAINRNVSNREFLDSVGPEVVAAMGWTEDSWGIDYVDELPKGLPLVSMAGVSNATSFAAGGGHASYHGPRNTPKTFQMALCYDRIEKCNYAAEAPTFEGEPEGEGVKTLDLEKTLDKNGKPCKESIFNGSCAGKTEEGFYWTLDYSTKTPTSNSPKSLAPPKKQKLGKGHQSGKNSTLNTTNTFSGGKKKDEKDVKVIPGALQFSAFSQVFCSENLQLLTQTPFEYYSSQGITTKSVTLKRKDLVGKSSNYHKAYAAFVTALGYDIDDPSSLEDRDFTTKLKVVDSMVKRVVAASEAFDLEISLAQVVHAFNSDPEDLHKGLLPLPLALSVLPEIEGDVEAWVWGMCKTLVGMSLLDVFVVLQELAIKYYISDYMLFLYAVHYAYAVE